MSGFRPFRSRISQHSLSLYFVFTALRPNEPYQLLIFFSSRRPHTRFKCDWSSDVCSSDLPYLVPDRGGVDAHGVQADANDYNRSACTRPAYRVMNRLLTANGVVDYIVATDQHFVAEHAGVELRSCLARHTLVAVLW